MWLYTKHHASFETGDEKEISLTEHFYVISLNLFPIFNTTLLLSVLQVKLHSVLS